MFGGNGLSLADIAAVTRNGNGNGDSFGGNNGWWILIILFALFGWGRGGYGDNQGSGNGSNGGVVYPVSADMQRGFDTASIVTKLDGLANGICSLGYDQLSQVNSVNTNILQASNSLATQIQQCCCNIENLLQQGTFAMTTATNGLANQLQQCCCDLKTGQMQAEYNRATDTCAITTAIDRMADRIVANDNANFRSLYDQQVQIQMDGLKRENAALQARLTACDTQNMITAGNQYVVNTLRPTAGPSYIVPNPFTGQWGNYGYGSCNNTCCNNNGGWSYGF